MNDADIAAVFYDNPTSLPPSDAARTAEAIPASSDVALAVTGGMPRTMHHQRSTTPTHTPKRSKQSRRALRFPRPCKSFAWAPCSIPRCAMRLRSTRATSSMVKSP